MEEISLASKILAFAYKINVPLVNFIVSKGWYLRLKKKQFKKAKFRRLSRKKKKEIKAYWKNYGKHISTDWCAYFSYVNGIVDKRYIPESLYYSEITRSLNNYEMAALHHKNVQDQIFSAKQPKTLVRKIDSIYLNDNYEPISLEESLKICDKEGKVIIKPSSGTYGGTGIEFWNRENGFDKLKKLIESIPEFIIQEVVKQHPFFESIHPNSLNTLRLVTLLIDNKPVLLSTILRMGKDGSKVDNSSVGGVICPVDKEGWLAESAIQPDQRVITQHPDGFKFKGNRIPFFKEIIEDVYRQHYRVPYFKLIFWDYALSPEGIPILIEANIPRGQIDSHQLNNGPIFGKYTDRVLDYVYKGKKL